MVRFLVPEGPARLGACSIMSSATSSERHMSADLAARDKKFCPLCGKPNECCPQGSEAACWCSAIKISPGVLETIPAEARNLVCMCKACALQGQDRDSIRAACSVSKTWL
jgi:Cysteine-rich CWC